MGYTDTLRAYIPGAARMAVRAKLWALVDRSDLYGIYRGMVVAGERRIEDDAPPSESPGASYNVRHRLMHPQQYAVAIKTETTPSRVVHVGSDIIHHHPAGNRPKSWPCNPPCAACHRNDLDNPPANARGA